MKESYIKQLKLGRRAEDKQTQAIVRLKILVIKANQHTDEINDIIQLLESVKPNIS